jgi:N-acetylglucosaminyldiphosphoundecaprenol N-acetyl-beta-D-mannosaminyltransferase
MQLGHVPVDRVTFDEALDAIGAMVGSGGVVFTPNVDHVVLADTDAGFCRAYETVDLSVADGMFVVWASHVLGTPVPEKISGSDLVPRLLDRAEKSGWRVFLLGGGAGVAVQAADRLRATHPELVIAGTAAPRIDMGDPKATREDIIQEVRRARADIVLVGLGAPKQELWIHEAAHALRPAVLLGVGASLDFLAGTARRAPRWISAMGLEWAYRLVREPLRLWRRYLVRDPRFLLILVRDLFKRWRWRTA